MFAMPISSPKMTRMFGFVPLPAQALLLCLRQLRRRAGTERRCRRERGAAEQDVAAA